MLPDFSVVDLLQQLGVLINEPRFPQDIGCRVLNLQEENWLQVTGPGCTGIWDFMETPVWLCCEPLVREPVLQEPSTRPSCSKVLSSVPTASCTFARDHGQLEQEQEQAELPAPSRGSWHPAHPHPHPTLHQCSATGLLACA